MTAKKSAKKPAQKQTQTAEDLGKEARKLMRLHGVTTTAFKGRPALSCRHPELVPAADIKKIKAALRRGKI